MNQMQAASRSPMLAGDFLRDSATRVPERIALIGRGRRLTYAQFDEQVNCLAHALLDLNLQTGAKIAILSGNCPEYAIAYFAIARTPYISAHCSTRSSAEELAHVLNKIEAELVFCEVRFMALIESVSIDLDTPIRLVLLDGTDEQGVQPADISLQQFIRGKPAYPPDIELDENNALAITLTGGTTGLPKAVLVSHRARCASVIAAARDFGLDESDIVIAATPLFHAAGLFVWFSTAVRFGCSVVLPDGWDPVRFMKLVEREEVTAAFLVPSQLGELVSHPEFSTSLLKSLRNVGYAGAPMGHALAKRIRMALPGVAFTENYGQSEACPITIRSERHGENKLDTVGPPASNAQVGIVDQAGNMLATGEIGDIVTRGDQVFDGYVNDPEETALAFRLPGGWLFTGDIGFLDEDGFLTLVDRSKDMLVSGGENVYPAEIENALYQHESVAECAVFGIPDDRWGEVPAAHVVLVQEVTISEDELIDFCASKIARFKRPRIVRFVSSLPKTPVGKIEKHQLREPYWVGREKKI